MSRNLDPAMAAGLQAGVIVPAFLAQITFRSETSYIWTGYGPLVYGGNTYLGVGALAGLGDVTEGVEVRADGTSVSLSGIDPSLYGECMADIQVGAPAYVWFALLGQGQVIGQPYMIFGGCVDKPVVSTGPEEIAITLALESRVSNLQRANCQTYSSADQRVKYPDDTGFSWVEQQNDAAWNWGGRS